LSDKEMLKQKMKSIKFQSILGESKSVTQNDTYLKWMNGLLHGYDYVM